MSCCPSLSSSAEVTGERIRDKIRRLQAEGHVDGCLVPLGYEVHERRLIVNQSEAETVREIFRRYLELGGVRLLMEELNRRGIRSKVRVAKNGKNVRRELVLPWRALCAAFESHLYRRDTSQGCPPSGSHEPIVDRELWRKRSCCCAARRLVAGRERKAVASPLMGRLIDENGQSLTPSHAVKGERRYRYYVSRSLIRGTADSTDAPGACQRQR